jgi:hypothetical protein
MSLRERVNQIVIEVATNVANELSSHRNDQMQSDQQTMGKVVKVEEGKATVAFSNGSTTVGLIDTRTVREGDTVSVIGGKIF